MVFFFVAAYFIKLYVDPNILSKNGNFVIPVTIFLLPLPATAFHLLLSQDDSSFLLRDLSTWNHVANNMKPKLAKLDWRNCIYSQEWNP